MKIPRRISWISDQDLDLIKIQVLTHRAGPYPPSELLNFKPRYLLE